MGVNVIIPYPKRSDFHPDVIAAVKEFLIDSFKDEAATWPGYHCVILMDGYPRRISSGGGGQYQLYSNDIYLTHDRRAAHPRWLIGVLIAIAVYFRIHDDAEVRDAAIEMLTTTIAGIITPYQSMLVETYNGQELHEIAINAETKELAAKVYDEQGVGRYVLRDGVEIDFNSDESWHAFAVPVGRA